ncbi:MAG: TolC family protein, partial [Gammaproteobacteria bacterium]
MSNRVITGRQVAAAVVVVLVTGCASLPKDLGRSDVDALVAERGRPTLEADTSLSELVGTLTAEPLTADSAIHIALVNNPRLSGAYARLGFAAAEVYAAGRIRNPVFLGSFLDSSVSGQRDQVTLGLVVSFTDLLTVPARKRLAAGEFAAMKQSIGAEVLDIAAEAETAYYRSVSAKQVAALRRQIATASDLSAQLAGRFFDAGNLTPRELAMERAAASEQRLRSLDADVDAYAARTGLAEVLGLSTADAWDAPARLGVPLREEDSLESLLVLARQSRLDLAAARTEADVLADRLGVAGWTRWLGELDVGVERERETEGGTLTGPTVGWEIPIFNQHRDQLLRISADLEIAFAEVARL